MPSLLPVAHDGSDAFRAALERLAARGAGDLEAVAPAVREILAAVRAEGDVAVRRYVERFEHRAPDPLVIEAFDGAAALARLDPALRDGLRFAADRIERFHRRQWDAELARASFRYEEDGVLLGMRVRPLARVGVYAPGGKARYPSSVLMAAIPARVAGVKDLVLATPAPDDRLLAAAHLAGITTVLDAGGAHAIAALAYGTASIRRVDKIVGPGNWYVTAAKKMVAFDCAIDMLAGPTEIVVTSESGDAVGIAADLVAQAEHDPEALAILVTTNASLAREVVKEVTQRVKTNSIARHAIERNGLAVVASSVDEAREITNRLAPEHLTIDASEDLDWVRNAGSVFIGRYSPQPMGDYVSGPNHTLPTGGVAQVRGGLSVMDFLKVITVQEYTLAGLQRLGPAAITLANAEGLHGHAEAVRARGIDG